MATSLKLGERIWSPWTSLREDSPARTSVRQESASASRELAQAFGLSSPVSFGNLDPGTCSLRTYQACLFTTECDELSENFPDAGMWGAGSVCELATSEPPISES